jgi:uncharacterized protein (TIGR03083 family)
MENARFLECLSSDYGRILAIVPGHLDDRVPTCPEWTVADLVRHLSAVYLHKAVTMREGTRPSEWPPDGLNDEEPVALLERAYAEVAGEFSRRAPEEVSETFYEPDQSVGFWVRRMAQETVIHRVDAELAVGVPVVPVPDDLAVDGVDELLKVFVAYDVEKWTEDYADVLDGSPEWSFAINTDGASWRVTTSPGRFDVAGEPGAARSDVTIGGSPAALLLWAWNREAPGDPSAVVIDGNPEALDVFRRCVVNATQ